MRNLDDPATARRILRDISSCKEFPEITLHLGMVPASPDVEDLEHNASHDRKDELLPLAGELHEHAARIAKVMAAIAHDHECSQGDDHEYFAGLVHRSAIGMLCHLVGEGLVEVVVR